MSSLKGQVAIVTGASRGIGKSILMELASIGCDVVGVYKKNESEATKITSLYQQVLMIKADVGLEDEVKKVIALTLSKFGHIDILINNAGIDLFGKIETYKTDNWDTMVNTNLKSVFLFSKYAIPHLKKSANPVIINISSRMGFPQYTEPEFVVYSAVKAAVTSFSIGLSKELESDHIRVNCVIPTPTKTDMFTEVFTKEDEADLIERGKLGLPEDVAKLVLELIQDEKSNGKILADKRVSI